MKLLTKLLLIILLVIINSYLISFIEIKKTDIKEFFPEESTANQTDLSNENYYLFVSTDNPEKLYSFEEKRLIKGLLEIPGKEGVFLIFFNKKVHQEIIDQLSSLDYMGASIIGTLLSDEFIADFNKFLFFFIPLIVPLLAFVTSIKFVLNTTIEVLTFSVLTLSFIILFNIGLNASYLLALLFSYIYIFTLINQIYFNKIKTTSLALSLFASLITTWLSALLLSYSGFKIISDFGNSLMLWIAILAVYMGIRLIAISRTPQTLEWFKIKIFTVKHYYITGFIALFTFSFLLTLYTSSIQINFNPLGMSAHKENVESFEQKFNLSQPILLTIKPKNCQFRDLKCNQKLSELITEMESNFSVPFEPILDLNTLYSIFTEEQFEQITQAKFAQFKLGLDMMSMEHYLYGKNFDSANYITSISLLESVPSLIQLKTIIENFNVKQNDFNISIQGHLSKIENYQSVFLSEMLWSLFSILLLLAIIFMLFYKSITILVSLLPAILSVAILLFIYNFFGITISVITLIAIILFIGIVTDNIIHILIIYKKGKENHLKIVFKPIILSNLILILSLALMAIVNDGLLQAFGLKLAILLVTHLVLLVYLLPSLLQRYLPRH